MAFRIDFSVLLQFISLFSSLGGEQKCKCQPSSLNFQKQLKPMNAVRNSIYFHLNCCNRESLKWSPNWAVSRQVNGISAHRAIFLLLFLFRVATFWLVFFTGSSRIHIELPALVGKTCLRLPQHLSCFVNQLSQFVVGLFDKCSLLVFLLL